MMQKTVLGVFSDRADAEEAIDRLKEADYNPKDVSIVMKDTQAGQELADTTGSNVATGAASGATTGAVLGGLAGLLIGIGAIAIPGIGAILIGGPLAAALGLTGAAATTVSGAATGALAGGLLGALMGLGVPEEDARIYEERINEGGILVAVPARPGEEGEVRMLLEESGADTIRSLTLTQEKSIEDEEFEDIDEADGYVHTSTYDRGTHVPTVRAAGRKGGRTTAEKNVKRRRLAKRA